MYTGPIEVSKRDGHIVIEFGNIQVEDQTIRVVNSAGILEQSMAARNRVGHWVGCRTSP
jgi:hypothetical protein